MNGGRAGRQLEGTPVVPLGPGPVEVAGPPEAREQRDRLSLPGVELDGALRFGARLRARLGHRAVPREAAPLERFGEARVRERELRIGLDRLSEQLDALLDPLALRERLRDRVRAEEDEPVRLRIDRPARAEAPGLLGAHGDAHLAGDGHRDLALEGQDVSRVARVALRPEVPVRIGLDELDRDPHVSAVPQHRAFHDAPDAERAGDLGKRFRRVLVRHHGRPRDHLQRADARQLGDHGLGHSVREVLLLGILREIRERQDGERVDPRAPFRPAAPELADVGDEKKSEHGEDPQQTRGERESARARRRRPRGDDRGRPGSQPLEAGLQLRGRRVAHLRALPQARAEDLLEAVRSRGLSGKIRLRVENRVREARRNVLLEGAAPGRHLAEDDSRRPDVCSAVHALGAQLLGRHVRKGPGDLLLRRGERLQRRCVPARREPELRDAEVQDLEIAAFRQLQVRRLEIAVNDALGVRRREAVGELRAEPEHLPFRERSLAKPLGREMPLRRAP